MLSLIGENRPLRFCALEYRPQDLSLAAPSLGSVVLIVAKAENGSLRFLVHPEWRTVIRREDLSYFESLLPEFLERAQSDPEALFKQLSSLRVGPLVTQEIGERISDHPTLLELSSRFVQI